MAPTDIGGRNREGGTVTTRAKNKVKPSAIEEREVGSVMCAVPKAKAERCAFFLQVVSTCA